MTQSELFAYSYFFGLALLVSVILVLGLGVLLQFERSFGRWIAIATVPMMATGVAVSSLLSGRDLKYAFSNIEGMAMPGGMSGTWLLRALTVSLMGLCIAGIVGNAFKRRSGETHAGQGLLASFLVFYLFNSILNSIFGTVPAFSHNSLYVALAFIAVFLARDEPIEDFIRAAKLTLVGLMLLSLLAAIVRPALAVQPDYKGWIPMLHFRLWGVGSNPNSIGPLALLLTLLEVMVPARRKSLRWLAFSSAFVVLLLAQSKTAWGAALVAASVLFWYRFARRADGKTSVGLVLATIAILSTALLAVMFGLADHAVDRLLNSRIGTDVYTLTGRLQIWSAALAAWRENPLFGYGPTAWGPLHRMNIGMPFAFSAHNQFMQSLSVAGTGGLLSLLVFMALLALYAWRAAGVTRGVSIALLLTVFVRCLTEAPMSVNTLFNGDTITLLVLFRVALLGAREPRRQPARSTAGANLVLKS